VQTPKWSMKQQKFSTSVLRGAGGLDGKFKTFESPDTGSLFVRLSVE
jgi:hypothetical protein